jgi:hypothetical protein
MAPRRRALDFDGVISIHQEAAAVLRKESNNKSGRSIRGHEKDGSRAQYGTDLGVRFSPSLGDEAPSHGRPTYLHPRAGPQATILTPGGNEGVGWYFGSSRRTFRRTTGGIGMMGGTRTLILYVDVFGFTSVVILNKMLRHFTRNFAGVP